MTRPLSLLGSVNSESPNSDRPAADKTIGAGSIRVIRVIRVIRGLSC